MEEVTDNVGWFYLFQSSLDDKSSEKFGKTKLKM